MSMRFGSIPTVIVSSPAGAELFLKTHDLIFANRPYHEASWYLGYEQRNIVFAPYSPYWREMRKLCTLELLSNVRIGQFRPMREREIGLLVDSLRQAGDRGEAVDMSIRIAAISADLTCLMVFGKKYEDKDLDAKGFKQVMKEVMEEAAAFDLGDYFPYLRGLDILGSARRLKNLSKIFDGFLERIIDEHVQDREEKHDHTMDFVDTMMGILESGQAGFDFDRRHVKAVLLDILVARMDTSASTVEWTLSEVIKHPKVMKKIEKELADVVGRDKMVEETHLSKLKYLDYVIRESLRLHPVVPFLIHESMEECEVDGYYIPNKTRVVVNVWAIGRDPDAWSHPQTFSPERFVENNVDVRGRDFQLIPFGTLGFTLVQFIVAQLLHCFNWKLPDGMLSQELNMDENSGLVTARAHIPIYRLQNSMT